MVQKYWEGLCAHRVEGYEVELLVATGHGSHRVMELLWVEEDTLLMRVIGEDGRTEVIFAPVEQCSFLVRHFRLTPPNHRVVVGFSTQKARTRGLTRVRLRR